MKNFNPGILSATAISLSSGMGLNSRFCNFEQDKDLFRIKACSYHTGASCRDIDISLI